MGKAPHSPKHEQEGAKMKTITDEKAYEMYDNFLDEMGTVEISNLKYNASRVLKELDPTAYNCGFTDYVDSLLDSDVRVEGHTTEEETEGE